MTHVIIRAPPGVLKKIKKIIIPCPSVWSTQVSSPSGHLIKQVAGPPQSLGYSHTSHYNNSLQQLLRRYSALPPPKILLPNVTRRAQRPPPGKKQTRHTTQKTAQWSCLRSLPPKCDSGCKRYNPSYIRGLASSPPDITRGYIPCPSVWSTPSIQPSGPCHQAGGRPPAMRQDRWGTQRGE